MRTQMCTFCVSLKQSWLRNFSSDMEMGRTVEETPCRKWVVNGCKIVVDECEWMQIGAKSWLQWSTSCGNLKGQFIFIEAGRITISARKAYFCFGTTHLFKAGTSESVLSSSNSCWPKTGLFNLDKTGHYNLGMTFIGILN